MGHSAKVEPNAELSRTSLTLGLTIGELDMTTRQQVARASQRAMFGRPEWFPVMLLV